MLWVNYINKGKIIIMNYLLTIRIYKENKSTFLMENKIILG